jgi:transposase
MGRPPKFSREIKLDIVQRYLQGEKPCLLIKIFGCSETALNGWAKKYQRHGIAGLGTSGNRNYSKEFRRKVAEAYQSGAGSTFDVAIEFGIPSGRTVSSWIKYYNSHEEKIESFPGGRIPMTKGRKTTLEERVEIVEYCIEHELDYIRTAEQFEVSYQQVYTWMKKYKEQGISALKDNRGKSKNWEEMTELERLKAENKQLRMENDVLKKLAELERGRNSGHKRRNI